MNLIYMGCSLSAHEAPAPELAKLLNLNLVNLAQGAGSNMLQYTRLLEYVVNNEIHDTDVFVWQLTWFKRPYARLSYEDNILKVDESLTSRHDEANGKKGYSTKSTNYFDKKTRIDLLLNSKLFENQPNNTADEVADNLEKMLALMILINKINSNLFVYKASESIGASHVYPVDFTKTFISELQKRNIKVLEISYLEWVLKKDLPFRDEWHPHPTSGIQFAREVLYPKISNLIHK